MAARITITGLVTLSVLFALAATAQATDVVWTTSDGGSVLDAGRSIVADKCWTHADFETGPLPRDKSATAGDDSDVIISFDFETLKFPAKVGIKSGYRTYLFDLDGCQSGGSRVPREDCKVNGNIRLAFSAHSKKLFFLVADGKYPIHDLAGTDHPYTIVADLGKGSKLRNFLVQSREEAFVAEQEARGALKAFAGDGDDGHCAEGSADCGGSCFGVCLNCGPPRYCMCFPDGYTDVYGKKHLGPHCLKRDGVGQTVPAAAHGIQGEPGHKAFEKSAGVDLQKLAQLTKKLRLLFGRDGWKDHAADVGITPQIAAIIEHMMEAEDAKPGFLDEL